MKILIATDMEGISGVVKINQTDPSHPEYQRFRRIMTGDVNAAIQGAALAGADEFYVTDGHWNADNILIEELDPRARLNSGHPSPLAMVQGADEGMDAAFFVGYHARIGTEKAILDHTWSSTRVANLWLNGRLVGETGLNAAVCGAFGVPVILVTGDQAVCAEARDWLPGVETVQVKRGQSRHAAECLSLEEARDLILQGAAHAMRRFEEGTAPAPLKVTTPVEMIVEFIYSDMADRGTIMVGAERLDGRRIRFYSPDMPTAYRNFQTILALALR